MATDYGFLLGYAGYGKIGESNVRILSGNVMRTLQIPTAGSFYSGTDNLNYSSGTSDSSGSSSIPISKIRLGYGVYSFNGSITLEITKAWLQGFLTSNLFQRTHSFNLTMNDGEQKLTLNGNVWNSISFNYAAQQIPTCSISFQSYNGYSDGSGKYEDLQITSVTPAAQTAPTDLINYWESGISGMECENFNLTFNRQVTPVYLNGSGKVPSYIKASLTEMNVSATCYDVSLPSSFAINLGGVTVKIPNTALDEALQNKSYNISGLNSAGMRVFTLTGIRDSSAYKIFTIETENKITK